MLRGEAPTCPTCGEGQALDQLEKRLECGTCHGSFLTEPVLNELAEVAAHQRKKPLVLEFKDTVEEREPLRRCPHCMTNMTKYDLETFLVDRCAEHGVWFDGEELSEVLKELGTPPISNSVVRDLAEILLTGAVVVVDGVAVGGSLLAIVLGLMGRL